MLKLATKFAPRQPAFEQAHRAGFRCAEFWLNGKLLGDCEQIIRVARHYPMEYVPHFPNRGDLTDESLMSAARLYSALGCRAMVIHRPMLERYGSDLLRIEPSLRLAVENHRLSKAEFAEWADTNEWLTLDVEHLWKFTLEDGTLEMLVDRLRRFLSQHAPKLRHVHLPGYVPGWGEHRPMYCSRDMVFAVFSLLAEFEYRGLIVSEIDGEYQTPNDMNMDVLLFDTWRAVHDPLAHSDANQNSDSKELSGRAR